jgi:transposase
MKSAVAEPWLELGELTPDALRALVVSLRAQLACQDEQIVVLEGQVTALQAEAQDLRTRLGQDSSNSSRPPSSDSPKASAQNRAKRKRTPTGRNRGGQPGHPGRFRALLPPEQVDDIVVVTPEVCGHCGQPFPAAEPRRRSRPWRRQVVEFVGKLSVRVTEYQLQVRRCASCGKRTGAALPAGVPASAFGPQLTAVVAMLTGRFRLTHREVREVLATLWDVAVSLGGVARLQQVQSAAIETPYTEVREAIKQAAVVNMDETSWREDKHRAWLWTVVTATLTVFLIDPTRSGAVVDTLLGEKYAGVVGSDRYAAYSRFAAKRRALCWAHLKRDFAALAEREGEAEALGRWGLAEIARMFVLWHRFRAGEFDRAELIRRMVPLQARMGRLLRRGREGTDPKAAGLCRELTKWWDALWTFTRVEGVEPTNNVSERALRPAVLWRKGSFGSDSPAGSRFVERLMTVAATCRQQGRQLLDFLVAAGEAALNGTPAPSLLSAPLG